MHDANKGNQLSKKDKLAKIKANQGITEGQLAMTSTQTMIHQGPIPDPMTLRGYEDICPGAADRILKMAENQSSHRQDMEKSVISTRSRDSLLGIIAGFLIATSGVICGTVIIVKGYELTGFVISGGTLTAIVSSFIYGTRQNKEERASKLNS